MKRNHRKLCCLHRCHDQLRRGNENETQHQNHNLKLIIASLCGFKLVRVKRFWLFYTSPTIVTHYTNRLAVATTAGRQLCRSKSNPGNTPAASSSCCITRAGSSGRRRRRGENSFESKSINSKNLAQLLIFDGHNSRAVTSRAQSYARRVLLIVKPMSSRARSSTSERVEPN